MLLLNDLIVCGSKKVVLLNGVSFVLEKGARVGLTGPSGAGKTTLIKAIMGMDGSELTVISGDITLEGNSITGLSNKERRVFCGKTLGFIPQNPITAFFRNAKIGTQVIETFMLHTDCDKKGAKNLASEMLTKVNLTDLDRIMGSYPSQLSGGMLQRVVMAIILGTKPFYILADEPTSALDSANRDLLMQLLKDYTDAGILFISHDAGAMKELCNIIHVLHDGKIIETQPTESFFQSPQQSWSKSFVEATHRHEEEIGAWKELK